MNPPNGITVIGAGYVGLATTALLVELGRTVTLLDVSEERIRMLRDGATPIVEPGLTQILDEARASRRVSFETEYGVAAQNMSLVFLAVGTPTSDTGEADLSHVFDAVGRVQQLRPDATVVIRSTVPPGTNALLHEKFPGISFISNPEFLQQGSAVANSLSPHRIVIGARDEKLALTMRTLFAPVLESGAEFVSTDPESAEIIKYAANSFLAVKVAFINEIADLCEAIGADVDDVSHAVGLDPRIGPRFLQAGPGFGGSCLPKDTLALVTASAQLGAPTSIIAAVEQSNRNRRASLAQRVLDLIGATSGNPRIAVLGLTFKAGTDDLRESPAVDLVQGLIRVGADVTAYDPESTDFTDTFVPGASIVDTAMSTLVGADALVVATEWPEFRELDFVRVAASMRGDRVIDLRNMLDVETVTDAGLTLHQIGKPLSGTEA